MKRGILIAVLCVAICAAVETVCRAASSGGAGGPAPWWSDRTAGWIGGIVGTAVGILGGVIGILTGMGKARRFVMATFKGLIAFGIVSLVFGLAALLEGQPYAVYYPALLVGFIVTLVFSVNMPAMRRRYEELELRRMRAQDARDA